MDHYVKVITREVVTTTTTRYAADGHVQSTSSAPPQDAWWHVECSCGSQLAGKTLGQAHVALDEHRRFTAAAELRERVGGVSS